MRLEMHECGRHTVTWDGRNERGHRVASGIYFVQIGTELGTIRQNSSFCDRRFTGFGIPAKAGNL